MRSPNLLKIPVLLGQNTRTLPQEKFIYPTIARFHPHKYNLNQSNLSSKLSLPNN
ncbi:hypothetical protein H1P_320035 [Hyella patelloides LEGE 07179]|uniref:Uncharacterized protein n=1 Tax=Hyella patelloides LEGE 07179 TaxID=945734 RepID=A0A563VUV9_9CYAN|nr:hypothetical protein H1P_320035 [Hyella patelloides LEGE 07179]